eukprot:2495988-Prymnesium_polylepis.1
MPRAQPVHSLEYSIAIVSPASMSKRRPDEPMDEDDVMQPPLPGQADYYKEFFDACAAGDPRVAGALAQEPGLARAVLDAETRWTGLHAA